VLVTTKLLTANLHSCYAKEFESEIWKGQGQKFWKGWS